MRDSARARARARRQSARAWRSARARSGRARRPSLSVTWPFQRKRSLTCAPVALCSQRAARTTPFAIARTGVPTAQGAACHVLACACGAPPSPCVHRNGPSPPSGNAYGGRRPGRDGSRAAARARAAAAAAAAAPSRRHRTGGRPFARQQRRRPRRRTRRASRAGQQQRERRRRRARARAARRAFSRPRARAGGRRGRARRGPRGSRRTRAESSRALIADEHVLVRVEAEVRHPRRVARVEPEVLQGSASAPRGRSATTAAAARPAARGSSSRAM